MKNKSPLSPTGYQLYKGNTKDRALLLEFLELTYRSLFSDQASFPHLSQTVDSYFSWRSPLWWVSPDGDSQEIPKPIAGLWLGNAIDQVTGDRHGHIFMLYVAPAHRRQGIATALLNQAQQWGQQRGDKRLGLQVFTHNPEAIALYEKLGFTPRALLLEKKW
jgi:ribosomal protein S18 acetylase RimI-like enzyme